MKRFSFSLLVALLVNVAVFAADSYVVHADKVAVYNFPSTNPVESQVVDTLLLNQVVEVYAFDGPWALVRHSTGVVYVAADALGMQAGGTTAPTESSEFASVPIDTPSEQTEFATSNQKVANRHCDGGLEIGVSGWKTAGMIDLAYSTKWIYLGMDFGLPTSKEMHNYFATRVGGGFHYRYHMSKHLYIDGRAGLYYNYVQYEMRINKKSESIKDHDGCFAFRPCLGADLFSYNGKEFSLFIAYEGTVGFKGGGYSNAWNAGICFGL